MFRYLWEAYWLRIGGVPANFLVVLAFVGLGFWKPWFWGIGISFEVLYLFFAVRSRRFRKATDAAAPTDQMLALQLRREKLAKR
mgnify:CR=1 FL=1